MITWNVVNGAQKIEGTNWVFPSFPAQEFLLPLLNVGRDYIDEYGRSTFQREDCFRMKGNITYLLDSGLISRRPQIRYDSLEKGLVSLVSAEIEACLLGLRDALNQALATGGVVVFYGD